MKTCARCGRTYPPDQNLCSQCGLSLPGLRGLAGAVPALAPLPQAGPADPRVEQIDFVLGQFDEWVRSGWVAPEQARHLWDIYQDRRRRLLLASSAFSTPITPVAAPIPMIIPAPLSEIRPTIVPIPVPRRKLAMAAFLEERNLSFWQFLGALLLLAGLVGLIGWTWGTVGKSLVMALMLALTGGLTALAQSRFVRGEPLTRSVLSAIAALLVPLDCVAVNAFRVFGGALGSSEIGLVASLACLPLYGWLMRRESGRWPAGLLGAAFGAALFFGLQIVTQKTALLETRGLEYGISFACSAAGFLFTAWRTESVRREVWLGAAHVSALAGLALALWLGGSAITGSVAAPLFLLGVAYAVAATLFESRAYVFAAQSALTLGGVFAVRHFDRSGGLGDWAVCAVWTQAVGFGSLAASRQLGKTGRTTLLSACTEGSLALAGLAVAAQAVALIADFVTTPALILPASEVAGFLLPALLSFGFFAWTRRGSLAASALTYLFVLVYWLGASFEHFQPNFALPLAAAALTLWALKRPQVSLVAALIALLLCVYAASSGFTAFWPSTVIALPLLVLAFALREKSGEDGSVWPLFGALTLEILLLETRFLPWAQTAFGWEPNYGFGLVPITLLGLGVSQKCSRWWLWAGLWAASGNALLQLGYSGTGQLAYSPLLLLALGAFVALGIGLLRPASRAAEYGLVLLGAFYLAFLLGFFPGHGAYAGRELLISAVLVTFALLTAWLAVWVRRPPLIYPAVFVAALGEAHGLHHALNPASAVYAASVWPLAAGLYAAGIWAERGRGGPEWRETCLNSAATLALGALLLAAAETLLRSPFGTAPLLGVVCAYGALFARVSWLRRSRTDAVLAVSAFSGAFWLAILQANPAGSGPKHGFALSLVSFLWLALGAGVVSVPRAKFAARALSSAAIGVALTAVFAVLFGIGGADAVFAVYTLLVAGSALIGASYLLSQSVWGQAGVGAYFIAYFAFLGKHLGAPDMLNTDFYLIPAGLYVLGLGLWVRHRAGRNTPGYFLVGLLLTLTPTFVAAWPAASPPVHSVLLLSECVAAVFYGITGRVKIFVGIGFVFLVALLLHEAQGVGGHIHWAFYATGFGLLILGSALYFEKRGAAFRRWTQATREKLSKWD